MSKKARTAVGREIKKQASKPGVSRKEAVKKAVRKVRGGRK